MVLIPYTARDTTLKQSPGEGRGRGAPRGDQLRRLPRALPPHWNTLANYVTDHPLLERRIGGDGPVLDPLEWDVKLYLALNGAVHDAAVCAWGLKGHYDYVRPITAIRHMAGLGQSSDPELPSYDPHGLPLEPGLAELITEQSAAPGERHAHLAEHIGEIAVYSWLGKPEEGTDYTGVDWILGIDWVPYQRDTFVTPPFAGYISGHSTFSRSAAEVMALFTGSEYFPGGLGEFVASANEFLVFETGPTETLTLQWATYYDAFARALTYFDRSAEAAVASTSGNE